MKKILTFLLVCVMSFALSITCFAANSSMSYHDAIKLFSDGLPEFDIPSDAYEHMIIFESAQVMLVTADKPFIVDGDALKCSADCNMRRYYITSVSSTEWTRYAPDETYRSNDLVFDSVSSKLKWSNEDLYKSDGGLYMLGDPDFRGPLPEVILEVAGEELRVKLPQMVGTMKILAVCGVGLMALLISLPLLRKVLSRFLP